MRAFTTILFAIVLGTIYASSYQAMREAQRRIAFDRAHVAYLACVKSTRDFDLCGDMLETDLSHEGN